MATSALLNEKASGVSIPPRLCDVAQRAGVSRSTASKVLLGTGGPNTRVSDHTAQRVLAAARDMHFQANPIARQLGGIRSSTLGLIQHHGFTPIIAHRQYCIETQAAERGYRMMLGHAHADPQRITGYMHDFTARGVEGIIAIDFRPRDAPALLEARVGAVPVVFQGPVPVPQPGVGNVMLDRAAGVAQAVQHLTQRGRRRIGLVMHSLTDHGMTERLRGYRAGISAAAGTVAPECLLVNPAPAMGMAESTGELWHWLKALHLDAVITPGDQLACALVLQAPAQGVRVPEDLAVVGFDNSPVAEALGITSLDQNNEPLAQRAVTMLLQLIAKPKLPATEREAWIAPTLVVRRST